MTAHPLSKHVGTPGDAELTEEALDRLLEGQLGNTIRKVKSIDGAVHSLWAGAIALTVQEIQENRVKVDMLLLDKVDGTPLIKYEGVWVEPGGTVTFDSTDGEVVIAARVFITANNKRIKRNS
jgi:hypothetical protein